MSIMLREVGTPIITRDGKLIKLTELNAFKQRIWNLFNTQLGTITMFPQYGFDALGIKDMNSNDIERGLYSFALDALNPENVEGLNKIISLEVNYADQVGQINITLLSDYGQLQTNYEVNVDEL